MLDIDKALRPHGRELLIHPSTTASATIAGFVAGGSGGIGSAAWGQLRDRGNITAMEVMSAEAEPQLVELTGQAVALVHHAWGTNGLITEVEMPTGPAWTWHECLVAFADFMTAARFGIQLAHECGLIKKLISLQEWPLPSLMKELSGGRARRTLAGQLHDRRGLDAGISRSGHRPRRPHRRRPLLRRKSIRRAAL